jgi:hypothetical protein
VIDFKTPPSLLIKGIKRGGAPLRNSVPSPLMKGRGIKGEGLVNNLKKRITLFVSQ